MALSEKTSTEYLKEVTIRLQAQGFTVCRAGTRNISVDHGEKPLCRINSRGDLSYFEENAAGKETVLDQVRDIIRSTREYMTLMEQAPPLKAEGLGEGCQLLADFNGTVLAGHKTHLGVQFITWDWTHNRTSLWQGHYYGPSGLSDGYEGAKRDFAVRSGLLPASALFTEEQLTEVYRSIHETLDGDGPLTDERRKALESAARQIEEEVPDLAERVGLSSRKELELARELEATDTPTEGGMEFH